MPAVRILGPDGQPVPRDASRNGTAVRARYDAAQTTTENVNHWANADGLSARAANSPEVRRKLRERARYERDNNCYCGGMVETLANDVIGTGPRLQLLTDNEDVNRRVAESFEEWTVAVGLAQLLRTYREARTVDGEAFSLLDSNPGLPTRVKLTLTLIEADHVTTPGLFVPTPTAVDGIVFDRFGNPKLYHVLREHPGDWYSGYSYQYENVDARLVLHWFKRRRPGQCRGVPEITPALPLYALMRRYTLATVSAAEIAALFAAIIKSNLPPDDVDDGIHPFQTTALVRGMMTFLPDGYDPTQLKAEQPTTTYPAFKRELLCEIAKCLNVPYNVAAGNSSEYNYSSGRLDHQVYHRAIGVDRYHLETAALDRILAEWLREARLADPEVVRGLDLSRMPKHGWYWDGFAHVDPTKEAAAQAQRLYNGTTTLEDEWAEAGYDWREKADQQARERAYYVGLGIPYPPDSTTTSTPAGFGPGGTQTDPNPRDGTMQNASMARILRASGDTGNGTIRLSAVSADVRFQAAADGSSKRPTFAIKGYTGGPMNVAGWYSPVIVDLAGFTTASQEIPALRDHDTGRIVGQTDSVKIDASGVDLTGIVTGENADATEVVSQSKNGFKWQASVGADVLRREFVEAGKKVTVNGREVTGPLVIAREAVLKEISFVALGADSQTSANVAASNPSGSSLKGDRSMNFEAWLKAKGFDPAALSDSQKAALEAAYKAEYPSAPPAPTPPPTPAPVQAGGGPTLSRLDQILADQAAEQDRVERITSLTESAIAARPAMHAEFGRIAKAAIEGKSSVNDFELAVLRVRANIGPAVHARGDVKATAKVLEATVLRSAGYPDLEKAFDARTLEQADDQFPRRMTLRGLLMLAARENGYDVVDYSDIPELFRAAFDVENRRIRAQGYSTISVPTILSNSANKFMAQGFNSAETAWREIARIRPVNDLKSITSATLTGGFVFEKVGPGGELKHASVGETTYTNKADTYGKIFALTREHLLNDDLGAFLEIPQKIGRGAAIAMNQVFWTAFLANRDTFWSSGHANLITGTTSGSTSVLSSEGLRTGTTKFRKMTDPDGKPLGARPRILLTPPEGEFTAAELMNSTLLNTGGSSTVAQVPNANVFAGKYRLVTSDYLSDATISGYSTTHWFLLADPMDLSTIEVVLLNGRDVPVIESADVEFGSLGVQFRGYWDFGVTKQEYRASVRAAGA